MHGNGPKGTPTPATITMITVIIKTINATATATTTTTIIKKVNRNLIQEPGKIIPEQMEKRKTMLKTDLGPDIVANLSLCLAAKQVQICSTMSVYYPLLHVDRSLWVILTGHPEKVVRFVS